MIGVVHKIPFTLKKNPTSVSTGGALGCTNNWRSLAAMHTTAKAVPKSPEALPYLAWKNSPPTIQAMILPIHGQL